MPHVPDIELDAFSPGERGAAVDLCPSGDAGPDVEPMQLLVVVLVDLITECRPRADDRHVTADDVPELRELVDAQAAQEASRSRDSAVTLVDRKPRALRFRADDH